MTQSHHITSRTDSHRGKVKNQCTSSVNECMYSWKLPARIHRTNRIVVSSIRRSRNHNFNIARVFCKTVHQSSRTMCSVLDPIYFSCSWCAFSNACCKMKAVTWQARLVRCCVINESASPGVAAPACPPATFRKIFGSCNP